MHITLRRALAGVAAASFAALSVVALGTTASATSNDPEATVVVATTAPETPVDSGYQAVVYVPTAAVPVTPVTPAQTVKAPAYKPAGLAATGSDGWQLGVAGALALALVGSGLVVAARRSRQTA